MSSNYGKGSSGSLNNFNFDIGLGSRPKSLNDQRNQTSSYSYSSSTQPKPSWQQPNKPAWTHQPAPGAGLNGPTSMVGDIFGKSWNSSGPSTGAGAGIGIVEKNPNLFGDLVNSALGQGGKGSSNVPLKDAASTRNQSPYSMGNLSDSLPKTSNSANSGANWGSSAGFGGYSGGYNASSAGVNVNANKNANLGGPSMKSMNGAGSRSGSGTGGSRDPFGSLVDFEMKQKPGGMNSTSKDSKVSSGGDAFGDFQNASTKSTAAAFPSGGFGASSNNFMGSNTSPSTDDFGIFNTQTQTSPPVQNQSSNIDGFGFFNNQKQTQSPVQSQTASSDPLDTLFGPATTGAAASTGGIGGQQFSEVDDWGLETDFGGGSGHDSGGATTELEGLPPPPPGVTASSAKNKGMDNQKQGQYADAIKWLSWAVVLFERTGDTPSTTEVLSCRASCYKEVGEYKKAVADCTKVLDHDAANVAVLVQRALLYESMEKYRLGAEDLRSVLKIDPGNRIAKSTIHRLNKMAD